MVKKPSIKLKVNEKRKSKGVRAHIRRLKQAERKESMPVVPGKL